MLESYKPGNARARPVNPGDQFTISREEKLKIQQRLAGVENAGKADLFNNLSQQKSELAASFQQEVLAIFTSSNYNLDQTREKVGKMSVPKEWKARALKVLDNIESGRKYFTDQENIDNYIEIVKRQQNIQDLRAVDSGRLPVDVTKFGILPLFTSKFNAVAMLKPVFFSFLGLWDFSRYSIIINQNSPQFNINKSLRHELEHWFQLQLISFTDLNNKKLDEYISTIIAVELGAFLTEIEDKSFEQFWNQLFKVRFSKKVIMNIFNWQISRDGYYYAKFKSDFQNSNIPISERELTDKINPYLDRYKETIDLMLKNGQSIENVIIWLRSNRLKIYKDKIQMEIQTEIQNTENN